MRKSAFTLIELLMVVVILATLAGLSLLYGARPIESGKARAARAVLQVIYAAEREYCIHHLPNGSYGDLGTRGAPGPLVTNGYMDDPNDPDQRDWDYTTTGIVPGGPNDCGTFTAEATRRTGPNNGEFISIDQDGTFAGDFDPSS